MKRAGQFARVAARFSEYLFAPPPPIAAVDAADAADAAAADASAAAAAAGFQPGGALSLPAESTRAGLWIKAGSSGSSGSIVNNSGSTDTFCGLLVVVNLLVRNQSTPPVSQHVNVTLSKTMLASWPAAAGATAECVDGGADSGRFVNGVLENLRINGENTAVFQISNGQHC